MTSCLSAILPVIDLKQGQVVHGVGGRREQYGPIKSRLVASAKPGETAAALKSAYGFRDVYVADLDAIAGAPPDTASCRAIADAGLHIWLDAGIGEVQRMTELLPQLPAAEFARVVVGLESLRDPRELPLLLEGLGTDRAVFSLDLAHGEPLTAIPDWNRDRIVAEVLQAGFRAIIVLDLRAVGSRRGPSVARLCRQLRSLHPELEIISGGGVRGGQDVDALLEAGCDRVLVASALHDGSLTSRAGS